MSTRRLWRHLGVCRAFRNLKNDVFFLGRPVKDYGTPRLSKRFFNKNPFKKISAARIVYSVLLSSEIERFASKTVKRFIKRGKEEAKRIRIF
jgi:hypothetical protein